MLVKMESLERRERLDDMAVVSRSRLAGVSFDDYRSVTIKPDSVVYCDIPYRNKRGYDKTNKNSWTDATYEDFYAWCRKQKELTLISEYAMPDDFVCVAEVAHRSILSATANNAVTERLFVPRQQEKMYWERMNRGTLFGQ